MADDTTHPNPPPAQERGAKGCLEPVRAVQARTGQVER